MIFGFTLTWIEYSIRIISNDMFNVCRHFQIWCELLYIHETVCYKIGTFLKMVFMFVHGTHNCRITCKYQPTCTYLSQCYQSRRNISSIFLESWRISFQFSAAHLFVAKRLIDCINPSDFPHIISSKFRYSKYILFFRY